MSLLSRAFDFIAAASPASAPITTESAPSPPRERLQKAFAARDRAEQTLREATEATERVRALIGAAAVAENEAQQAAKNASEVTRRWAIAGARGDMPNADRVLLDQATDAERLAAQARLKADGAEAALGEVGRAEQNARYARDGAQGEVTEAVRAVLLAEIEGDFALIEGAQSVCAAAHERIHTLAHMLKFGKLLGVPSSGSTDLLRRLQASLSRTPSDDELRVLARPWIDLAKRLANDAGATLDDA